MVTLLVLVCADCDACAAPWSLLASASVRTELAEVLSYIKGAATLHQCWYMSRRIRKKKLRNHRGFSRKSHFEGIAASPSL